MKKRLLSILLVLVMAFSMLPVTALANNQDPPADPVVYGSYIDGEWVQNPNSDGTNEEAGITVSKTAEPTGNPNEYTITLTVETGTTTTTVASEAATVLIIDVSGSMDFCAECGGEDWHKSSCKYYKDWDWNFVTADQSRMAAAKAAANSFIGTYAGDTEGSGRYLAIVSFSTSASTVLGWTDVSTSDGKTSAENAISRLSANGGTNLDDALRTATGLMGDSLVSSLENKFTVALTDGAPTFYIRPNGERGG
ncbi:MAG: VWA domain-containing protein, partial [Oscillospiraceae bacterium]